MTELNLQDVKEVFESTDLDTANRYLRAGWVLLETYTTCYDPNVCMDHQTVHYVLAWAKDQEPVHPPGRYDWLRDNT